MEASKFNPKTRRRFWCCHPEFKAVFQTNFQNNLTIFNYHPLHRCLSRISETFFQLLSRILFVNNYPWCPSETDIMPEMILNVLKRFFTYYVKRYPDKRFSTISRKPFFNENPEFWSIETIFLHYPDLFETLSRKAFFWRFLFISPPMFRCLVFLIVEKWRPGRLRWILFKKGQWDCLFWCDMSAQSSVVST